MIVIWIKLQVPEILTSIITKRDVLKFVLKLANLHSNDNI